MSAVASGPRPAARLLRDSRLTTAALVLALLLAAGWVCVEGAAGHAHEVIGDIARGALATVGLFAIAGYAPARLVTPRPMEPHLALLVLPLGAMTACLALTLFGFFAVPFELSLGIVLAAGLVSGVLVRVRLGPARPEAADVERAGRLGARIVMPLFLAALIAGLTLMPSLRIGALTVPGENPDSHLVTGAAEVVRVGPPTEVQPDLPVDRVSGFWQSKYPIYYGLAAVAELSGLDPAEAFPILSAAIAALFGLGIFLFAYHFLRAGPGTALLALGVVSLDRVVLYLVVHPYYNQLWGTFALPFMLLFGFRFLREPDRRSALLVLGFLALGVFAYPLMLPFPAVALGVAAFVMWRRARAAGEQLGWVSALRLPSLRRKHLRVARWIAIALLGLVALSLTVAALSKGVDAAEVIIPGGDLNGWQGDSPDYPVARYFGLFAITGLSALLLVALGAGAYFALRRVGREERLGLAVMAVAAIAMALNFRFRRYGEYFEFKTFAFVGPVVLTLAVVGLARLARERWPRPLSAAAAAMVALLVGSAVVGTRDELDTVAAQSPPEAFELREWADGLPSGATIRIDIPPTGVQLWAAYMLHERPLSARRPVLYTTYPFLPISPKADYVLVETRQRRPPVAVGRPLRENSAFRLYRFDPALPGPDRSSRVRLQPGDEELVEG